MFDAVGIFDSRRRCTTIHHTLRVIRHFSCASETTTKQNKNKKMSDDATPAFRAVCSNTIPPMHRPVRKAPRDGTKQRLRQDRAEAQFAKSLAAEHQQEQQPAAGTAEPDAVGVDVINTARMPKAADGTVLLHPTHSRAAAACDVDGDGPTSAVGSNYRAASANSVDNDSDSDVAADDADVPAWVARATIQHRQQQRVAELSGALHAADFDF
jgi:hypothetical protein